MATKDINLPEIGEGVTEGELVKWLVKPGDKVVQDQPFVEMMTDKATVEVPSPIAGTVVDLKAKEGDVIQVGQALISVEVGAGATAATNGASAHTAAKSAPAKPAASTPAASSPRPGGGPTATTMSASSAAASSSTGSAGGMEVYPPAAASHVLATPHTRRLAREMNVDINGVTGTGLAGRVTREDVLSTRGAGAVAAGPAGIASQALRANLNFANGQDERVPLRGVRKKIAENLQMAKRIIPHFTLMDEANVTELVRLREQTKTAAEAMKIKVTYLPFVMKALIATCREFPQFNASIDDEKSEIVYKKNYNIGFAADTPQGLLVPVVHHADQKSILQISQEITDLATRARDGKLKPEEMKGATITITNIGSVGGTYATPIINHPEVAILGMYKIQDKPVIANGSLSSVKTMNFTITADHRLIDGAVAANFLKSFFARIENPSRLMLEMA